MTALSAKLQDFITQSNLKEDVSEWLVSVGILGYEEVALLADDLAGGRLPLVDLDIPRQEDASGQ